MLIVIVKLRTKPDRRENLIELAKAVLWPSRGEEGCYAYDFLQDPFEPECFTFYEKWRSRNDLELHFNEPHFKLFDEKSKATLTEPAQIVAFEVIREKKLS